MSTNIDSVMDVETIHAEVGIEQIPYKVLPVPYDDITSIPQPSRPQIYPDNVPPTVSTISAYHPDTKNAQSLHTDGDHALLVKNVDGGGGGSSPIIIAATQLPTTIYSLSLLPNQIDRWNINPALYLFGWQLSVWLTDESGTASGVGMVEYGIDSVILGTASYGGEVGATFNGNPHSDVSILLPYAIQGPGTFDQGFHPWEPYFHNTGSGEVRAAMTLFLGPDV